MNVTKNGTQGSERRGKQGWREEIGSMAGKKERRREGIVRSTYMVYRLSDERVSDWTASFYRTNVESVAPV